MKFSAAVHEYEEFYSDECISLLSQHLRRELNQRGADVWGIKQQWKKYLDLRSESVEYLKSIGEWHNTQPKERAARPVDIDLD